MKGLWPGSQKQLFFQKASFGLNEEFLRMKQIEVRYSDNNQIIF